jgi:hypothetical protein
MRRQSTDREQQTIKKCLQNFKALDGCQAGFLEEKAPGGYNGQIRLKGAWGKANYTVLARLNLTPKTVEVVANQINSLTKTDGRPLLITDYVRPKEAEALKRKKVEFIDTAGNIYLNQPPLYVDITGRKKSEKPLRTKRAFQKTGLKLIYLLLRRPQAINWNYRELANAAGIALGTVSWIWADLRELGFIRLIGPNLQALNQGRDLLNRWEIGYAELLRPKLMIKTCGFAGPIENLVNRIRRNSKPGEILIGGELGAGLLTNQLRPERATLHINVDVTQAMKVLQLYPHPQGNVDLLQVFGNQNGWDGQQPQEIKLADPLLIRAELLGENSERLLKIAKLIFNKYLAPRINSDQPE